MFHQMMQPRQRQQFQAVGEFLYVEACPGKVMISTVRGSYELKQGAQIIDPYMSGRVTVENLGEAGTVTLICGYGRYLPPTDGQAVNIKEMPPVTLSPEQSVNIGKLPAVKLEQGQTVVVSQLPKLQLEANQTVTVAELPAVNLAQGQTIQVTTAEALPTKPVINAGLADSLLTMTGGKAELAANPLRCHVLLKASLANTQPVTLGSSWALAPGEQLKLDTSGALAFTGTEGDTIQVIEVLQ